MVSPVAACGAYGGGSDSALARSTIVDSSEAQGAQAPFMPGPEPTGDLLRDPALGEAVLDEGP